MSALSEAIDKVKGFDMGAVDFITKPVYAEELISRVSTHLKINRLQEELQEINSLLEEKVLMRTEELMKANMALNQEIEERKLTEIALRESEEKFRAISESANDGIIILGSSGVITFANRAAEKIFEYGDGGMGGVKIGDLINMDDTDDHKTSAFIRRLMQRKGVPVEGTIMSLARKRSGALFPVDLSVSKIETGGERHLVMVARDLSERMEIEKRMHEIEEMEREKIAQDLHDGLGQHLTGIRYLLGLLILKMKNEQLPYISTAERLMELIDEAKDITRNLSRGFGLISLEKEGFIEAVNNMISDIREIFGVTCRFSYNSGIENKSVSSHIYFIIKELITNAIQHGKAGSISITMKKERKGITIDIYDDGRTYRPPVVSSRGKGLKIINYRLLKINGTIKITNPPEGGNIFSLYAEDSETITGA